MSALLVNIIFYIAADASTVLILLVQKWYFL